MDNSIMNEKILVTGGSGFIGTNLVDLLVGEGCTLLNFDKNKPNKKSHEEFWHKGNLLKENDLKEVFNEFQPTIVIHLAARTDTYSDKIEEYVDNTLGTKNLIKCMEKVDSLKHVVIASTQYVYKSSARPLPEHDTDYLPYTVYGESKVITEELTRESKLQCAWTIVRPANIWGPWHMRYPAELWKIIDKGWYIHPSKHEVLRTYGYVKNIVFQILQILKSDKVDVDEQTFYLGDSPIDSYLWLNEISTCLTGKRISRVPSWVFAGPVFFGDVLKKLGVSFPIYSSRFQNMIEDYPAPTNITVSKFGVLSPSLEENVKETVNWIRSEGKDHFEYWKSK